MQLDTGSLRIECHEDRGRFIVSWCGRSTERQPAKVIAPFVSLVLRNARDRRAPVVMRFEGLEYCNSSTITSLVSTIRESIASSVQLELLYDDRIAWQKLNFDALRVFARSPLVRIASSAKEVAS